MNPPARPIRAELNDALVGGIRERGPDAFGMVIIALARLAIGVITFAILFGISQLIGAELTALPYAGITGVSGLVSWLATRRGKAPGERQSASSGS
jgi:hypothetical protein